MIRALDLNDNSERALQVGALKDMLLRNVWLELVDPTDEEIQAVSEKTGILHQLLQLPTVDGKIDLRFEQDYNVIHFVVVRGIASAKEVHPVLMVFSKDYLVTVVKSSDQDIIDEAKLRMNKTKVDPPALVTYFIIDEIVSNHFIHLEKIEEFTSHIEEEVVGRTSHTVLKKILKLKTRLISLNKILWYERGTVFKLKTCSDSCMPAKARSLFDSVHEDLTRQIDIVETYREIMSDAINVHLSAVSNKINFSIQSLTIVIFYLTIVTTITSFPNTVATFFGISQFGNSPIIIIVVALLLSTILPVLWLWKKRWLKYEQHNFKLE